MNLREMLELREKRELHPRSESRIKELFGKIPVQNYGLSEAWGVAGSGRADVVVNLKQRQIIHFEVFGHASTVLRDVNNLHMSRADVKVAVIMDRDADPAVAESYFRAISDNRFPWFWLSLFVCPEKEADAIKTLADLIQEAIKSAGPLTGPKAALAPPRGVPFTRVRLSVSGFHPYSAFHAFWDPAAQTGVVGGGIETDEKGDGKCEIFVPDGRAASVGRHAVRVVDSVGNTATATFEVTEAWPAPYLRALPSPVRPGEQMTVVGGGAPRNAKIMVHFWNGNQGEGRPEVTADEAGNFHCAFEVPWLVGVELVKPGRHRVSADAARAGFPSYRVNTSVEVPEYSPPELLQWRSGRSQSQDGICVLRPEFTLRSDQITIRLRIRNDRNSAIQLLPGSGPVIYEFDKDLKYSDYSFAPVFVQPRSIQPQEEAEVMTQFRRRFAFLPKALLSPARSFVLVLLFATAEGQSIKLLFHDTWPAEVWAEPPTS